MSERKDHVITAENDFPTTPIARWDANIAAIRLSKELEAANRPATPAEQEVLGKYSGFGDSAFEQAFGYTRDPAWTRRKEELQSLVTEDELRGIGRSRINAFYTTPEIVRSMWDTLGKMGAAKIENPKVLEPSAGSGRFLGLQPPAMARRSERTAVELDAMTADILKRLYPKARVHAAGFEDSPTPDNHFDIAISNVPFGNVEVYDPDFNATGRKYLTKSVHNYFFAKTLDKLRPGGVMAYITSHHTMDAPSAKPIRRYLADRADLLGAVRLPDDAFPDTEVVTDVIYLKKRSEGEKPGDDSWVESDTVRVPGRYGGEQDEYVNRYYIDNPDRVIGQHSGAGSMYRGGTYTVKSTAGRPLLQRLQEESAEISRTGTISPSAPTAAPSPVAMATARAPAKYVVEDGELKVSRGGRTSDHDLSKKDADRVEALVGLRDAARQLVNQESTSTDHEEVESTRASLRKQYDDYVGTFDQAVNTPANRRLMGSDADDHLLFALEHYDQQTECWQPADIMSKRIVGATPVQQVRNASDALSASLNESGKLDFEQMGKMLGRSADEVRDELEEEQLVFKSPDGVTWIPRAEYLSGNVVEKLKTAKLAAESDPSYKRHVEALEQAQPVQVGAEDIRTPLGAPWIPADVVNAWVADTFKPYNRSYYGDPTEYFTYGEMGEALGGKGAGGSTSGVGGGWRDSAKINASDAVLKSQWGIPRMPAHRILLKTLQGAPIKLTKKVTVDGEEKTVQDAEATEAAQKKAQAMQESFEKWVWEDSARRERLERVYNETHNAVTPRVFDGSHLTFPGMALDWQRKLRPHQRDAIYRTVHDGTTLLAHEVGFGKTATMIASAMERKRMGMANKPVFVVPKATHEQFVGQFMEVYPGARLLVPDANDFRQGNREAFLSRIATGDWDGVILTTEHFEKIPLSPETESKWVNQQMVEMEGALQDVDTSNAMGRRTHKQIVKKIENYKVRLQELVDRMKSRSDDALDFEDLGIDQIYVDEADRYKNLPFVTNKGNVKGLPQSSSQRAWDMYMKIRWLQEKAGEKPDGSFAKGGVVFATGTPVANTIAETYTMMRYLQPSEMKRRGLAHFDAWAKTYGKETVGMEQTAAGTYRPVNRFSRFVNLPELSILFQNVADIRVASEVPEMQAAQPQLRNEKGEPKRITVVAPSHEALEDYMADIVDRVDNLKNVQPHEDNMLKISSDARKAALDVRMVDPKAPHNPEGKIPLAADNIARIFKEEAERKGTQLVFLDLGTPKANEGKDDETATGEDLTQEEQSVLTNVYRNLRRELAGRGIPEDQVAFIHDYKNANARDALFDDVRNGNVRVLVGSTDKIGVGVNVQDRAAAAHHIDVPWRPRDLEQREGRIIRQGNKVYGPVMDEETSVRLQPGRGIQIYQYVQEKSFDGFMWQAVESKGRPIKSLMKRHQAEREMEDADEFIMGVAEAKALATGNPLAFRAEELRQKVDRGRRARSAHMRQVHEAQTQTKTLERQVQQYQSVLPALDADADHVRNLEPGDFAATIGGREYDKRTEAAKALEEALKRVPYDPSAGAFTSLGSFKGFEVGGANTDQGYQVVIKHPDTQQPYHSGYVESEEFTSAGLMSRLDNLVKGIPRRADLANQNLREAQDSLKLYAEQIATPFGEGAELSHAERQLRVVQARLAGDPKMLPADYDYDMDVMTDWQPTVDKEGKRIAPPADAAPEADAAPTQRETPDIDVVDLRTAVEAVRSPEEADTPEEVAEALEDELETPTSVTPPTEEPEEPTVAMATVKEGETRPEAPRPDPKSEPVTRAPVEELDAIASQFNFPPFSEMGTDMQNMVLELWRTRKGLPDGIKVAADVRLEDKAAVLADLSDESATAPKPVATEPSKPASEAPKPEPAKPSSTEILESAEDKPVDLMDVVSRMEEERQAARAEEAKAFEEQTAPIKSRVPLTGPGNVLERAREEAMERIEQRRQRAQAESEPEDATPASPQPSAGEIADAADLIFGKLQEDTPFQNALRNTDRQNQEVEYDHAKRRVLADLLNEGRVDLYKWFSDDPELRERLDYHLRTKRVFVPKTKEDADTAERAEAKAEPDMNVVWNQESRSTQRLGTTPIRVHKSRRDYQVRVGGHGGPVIVGGYESEEEAKQVAVTLSNADWPTDSLTPISKLDYEQRADVVAQAADAGKIVAPGWGMAQLTERRERDAAIRERNRTKEAEHKQAVEPEPEPKETDEERPKYRYMLPSFVTAQYRSRPGWAARAETTSEDPEEKPKPKRKRRTSGKARRKAEDRDENTPEDGAPAEYVGGAKRVPASKVVIDGEPLYQGHKGPGIGYLKDALPERRDSDSDTVVGERRPRKKDRYEKSPIKLTGPYARLAERAKRRKVNRYRPRSKDVGLKARTGGVPTIRITAG